jgi:hypothetical protein
LKNVLLLLSEYFFSEYTMAQYNTTSARTDHERVKNWPGWTGGRWGVMAVCKVI